MTISGYLYLSDTFFRMTALSFMPYMVCISKDSTAYTEEKLSVSRKRKETLAKYNKKVKLKLITINKEKKIATNNKGYGLIFSIVY